MGGFAIQRFVDSLQDVYPNLSASRIGYTDLPTILPKDVNKLTGDKSVVAVLVTHLIDKGAIRDVVPVLDMGSTRLAAWHVGDGDATYLNRHEKPSDALRAMAHKHDFGDIDIGVRFAVDPKLIVGLIHGKTIGGYRFFARRVVDIHMGIMLDDERMVQVDLNNITTNAHGWRLTHFSSFLDLNERLSGVYQTSMIRALVNRHPTPDTCNEGTNKPCKEYYAYAEKAQKDGFSDDGARCSFTPDGFVYVVHEWSRPSKRNPDKTTRRKFKFDKPILQVTKEYDTFMQTLFVEYARFHLGDEYVVQNEKKLKHVGAKELFHLTAFLEFLSGSCPELAPAFLQDLEQDIDNYVSRSTPDASVRTAAKLRIKSLLRRRNGSPTRN